MPYSQFPQEVRKHISNIVEQANSSFYWSMRLQPQRQRDAIFSIYAFRRVIDNVVDGTSSTENKTRVLNQWRKRIERMWEGHTDHPITLALHAAIREFNLPQGHLMDIIDGMEMDNNGVMVAPSLADLETYCWKIAGSPGQLFMQIFCDSPQDNNELAQQIGEALQLTNILRDVEEDIRIGRLYIPKEILEDAEIETTDPLEVFNHPHLNKACSFLAYKAKKNFTEAEETLRKSGNELRPALVMLMMYKSLLHKLQKQSWQLPIKRVRLSKREKLITAVKQFIPTRIGT